MYNVYIYVYLCQAEDNLIDFSLWINNSATLFKTRSFQIEEILSLHGQGIDTALTLGRYSISLM